jgi:hypothetical protein
MHPKPPTSQPPTAHLQQRRHVALPVEHHSPQQLGAQGDIDALLSQPVLLLEWGRTGAVLMAASSKGGGGANVQRGRA